MPRSFLVKKVKLDDFSTSDLESSYGRSRTDFSLRLHEKGYISDYISPSVYDGESDNAIKVPSPEPIDGIASDYGAPDSDQPDSPQSEISSGYINGDNASQPLQITLPRGQVWAYADDTAPQGPGAEEPLSVSSHPGF
ncbi:hypothetical protein COCON_G00008400 [Conger conger]|uniref:Uncharacterized protein n=1 Tax=Conger conger TaxID=82655 RepID=A0A9Q1I8T8_CONCO|nr:hypothetical protein COCON_G00008400 [Conger conger]